MASQNSAGPFACYSLFLKRQDSSSFRHFHDSVDLEDGSSGASRHLALRHRGKSIIDAKLKPTQRVCRYKCVNKSEYGISF